jgi:predicted dehydrogenase
MRRVRWGILGCGKIARKFAEGLRTAAGAELAAVGARSRAGADALAAEAGALRSHGSYEALVADPGVDAVYVATPHPMHRPHTLLALAAGKAVLCEKPFAVNAGEAREMAAEARRRRLFLMEAMWTRFLPALVRTRELLAAGRIGEVRLLQADFGFRAALDPGHRLFAPSLAGGSLMDVGVYLVSLAFFVIGRAPSRVVSLAHLGQTGVDEQAAAVLAWDQGELAVISSAVRTTTPQEATVIGTEGTLRIESAWWKGTRLTLTRAGAAPETIDTPMAGNGYGHEAEEVARCLEGGLLESPVMSLDESIRILEVMDGIRAQWGLRYPGER